MQSITVNTNEFRLYLQNELVKRCKTNPRYSLRSFARVLAVSPSALSGMLSGKRNITRASVLRFAEKLKLGPLELQRFLASQEPSFTEFSQLTLDTFNFISEWYHFAILEILKVQGFRSEPAWVAKKLGLTTNEVKIAVERLVRLNLLAIDENGNWQDVSGGFTTNIEPGLTSVASKKFQQQILEKAIHAINDVPLEDRDNTSMTFAINSKDVPAAKKFLQKFRREMSSYLERSDNEAPDNIYNLTLGFYPLLKKTKEN